MQMIETTETLDFIIIIRSYFADDPPSNYKHISSRPFPSRGLLETSSHYKETRQTLCPCSCCVLRGPS